MNIPANLLDDGWYLAAWLLWSLVLLGAVRHADWRRLKDPEVLNVWLGMIVLLVLVWSLKAGVKPGLSLHLLGATLFTLCFGAPLAVIGLSLVLLGVVVNGEADGWAYALNALVLIGGGVGLSSLFTRRVQQYLPRHFFVFIFVNGFFGAAFTIVGVGVLSSALLVLSGAYEAGYLLGDYLPYFILLGFSEAWLSGMMVTLFVVYRPKWVASFDDSRYLDGK